MAEMDSSIVLLILCFFLVLVNSVIAQPNFLNRQFCQNNQGNYTTNSTYQANLDNLLSVLPSNKTNTYGFYNSYYGNGSNEAYAIGLCRGDIKPDRCRSCLNASYPRLTEICPNYKEAIIWSDECMLRYSNRSLLGQTETRPRAFMVNGQNISSNTNIVTSIFQDLRKLLDNLKNGAAAGDSLRKYATGNLTTSEFKTLYGLAQCTPELSQLQCNNCLDDLYGDIPTYCYGRVGGRILSPSCNFRYETYLFDGPPVEEAPPTSLPTSPPTTPLSTNPAATQGMHMRLQLLFK
ncbi:hypothetical protein UlMin_011520 [Ulmus minor]